MQVALEVADAVEKIRVNPGAMRHHAHQARVVRTTILSLAWPSTMQAGELASWLRVRDAFWRGVGWRTRCVRWPSVSCARADALAPRHR